MTEIQMVEFPFEEVKLRMDRILAILPTLGRNLLRFQEKASIRSSNSSGADSELMKKADRFAEESLIQTILQGFTRDAIISEEAGELGGDGEFQWWIDPVDGTRNFIHGLPMFCISVGLCFRGTPIGGIVHAPAFSDTYTAILGNGAEKNLKSILVSGLMDIRRALVVAGLPYHRDEILTDLLADISAFVTSGAGLRRTGSAILDICWIAEGRYDAMWERGMKPWDLCAASVILNEAGGQLSGFAGEIFDFNMSEVVASNGSIHTSIVEVLQKARSIEGMN